MQTTIDKHPEVIRLIVGPSRFPKLWRIGPSVVLAECGGSIMVL